jgi:hypothetical protein
MLKIDNDEKQGIITYELESAIGEIKASVHFYRVNNETIGFTLVGKTLPYYPNPAKDVGLFLQAFGGDLMVDASAPEEGGKDDAKDTK